MYLRDTAAETTVRLTIQGSIYVIKLAGTGAEHMVALLAAYKNMPDTSPGKKTLKSMLDSGENLVPFTLPEEDIKDFALKTKKYGIQYCIAEHVSDNGSRLCDILVRASDAARVNRVAELMKIGQVDATVKVDPPEQKENISETKQILNQMFSDGMEQQPVPPMSEQAKDSQFAGSSGNTQTKESIKQLLHDYNNEIASMQNMFDVATRLQEVDEFMPVKGWKPPSDLNSNETYRGKPKNKLSVDEKMQYMIDKEMAEGGKISPLTLSKLFTQGYEIDEEGIVKRSKTNLSKEQLQMLSDSLSVQKQKEVIR